MGSWMDQQLRIGESSEVLSSVDNHNIQNGEEGTGMDHDMQSESSSSDVSDSSTLEQRRAYKIELQV
jgi:brefeldin A-inhibited guanine nucleotide-exchange protein